MSLRLQEISSTEKVYFASDFHLGMPNTSASKAREKKIIQWLDTIASDAKAIVFVGDVFDFWFEYNHVIPKGSIRFLGKLAELSDSGVRLILFSGNHDIWYKDYLKTEFDIEIVRKPISAQIGNRSFYIAHGDGLAKGDWKFRIIRSIFTNPICNWLFGWFHPDLGVGLAKLWSRRSRVNEEDALKKERKLIDYSVEINTKKRHDYYMYGDCHKEHLQEISDGSVYVNLGEWIDKCSYAEFNGIELQLKYFNV